VFEGVLIGVRSWCVAIVLALPVTTVLDQAAGRIFTKTPLDFFMSPRTIAIWLWLVVVIAELSGFHPARRATRFTVREALAYG
jgi:putative ABC transport system permease protein